MDAMMSGILSWIEFLAASTSSLFFITSSKQYSSIESICQTISKKKNISHDQLPQFQVRTYNLSLKKGKR